MHLQRQIHGFVEDSIDPKPYPQAGVGGLDVNIRRTVHQGLVQEEVDNLPRSRRPEGLGGETAFPNAGTAGKRLRRHPVGPVNMLL